MGTREWAEPGRKDKYFKFFGSTMDIINRYLDPGGSQTRRYLNALCDYIWGHEEDDLSDDQLLDIAFHMTRDALKPAWVSHEDGVENGKRGGRPKGGGKSNNPPLPKEKEKDISKEMSKEAGGGGAAAPSGAARRLRNPLTGEEYDLADGE